MGTSAREARAKAIERAMEQHAQIVTGDVEFGAELLPAGLVEEDGAQYLPVRLRQLVEHAADLQREVLRDQVVEDARAGGARVGVLRHLLEPRALAHLLEEHVVADGVDEGAQALGLADAFLRADDAQNAQERLLTDVVDFSLMGAQAATQLDADELAEVARKVLLDLRVTIPEAGQVGRVKLMKLQGRASSGRDYSHMAWRYRTGRSGLHASLLS